jgi:hypothetical protein
METLTDREKQALAEVLDFYIEYLQTRICTHASIKFYGDLAEKLDYILYSEDND